MQVHGRGVVQKGERQCRGPCSGQVMHPEGQRVICSKSVILCWERGEGEAIMKNLCVYGGKCFGEKLRVGTAWRQLDLFY